jgi:O-antigen ligase
VCAWAFLLSVQLPGLTEGQDLSLALSDLVLVAGVLTTLSSTRIRAGVWSVWHFAMPVWMGVSAILVGPLTRYSVANKVVGLAVLLVAYAFITSHVWTWDDVFRVVRAFYAGVVVFSALGIARYALNVEIPFTFCQTCDVRLLGFMPDANLYGSLLVVALAAFIALDGPRQPLVPPALRWPSVLVLVASLALSSSRSAWLAMGGVVVVALISRRRRALLPLLAAAVAVIGAGFVFASERVLQFVDLAGRRHSIESRFALIDHAFDAIGESPLVGIGLGNSPVRYGQIIHNTLLWITSEMGVIGLVVFGGFLLWMAARLADAAATTMPARRRMVSFLIMGNVGMLVFSQFVEAFYQRHWWLLFALTASVSAVAAADREQDARDPTPRPVRQD